VTVSEGDGGVDGQAANPTSARRTGVAIAAPPDEFTVQAIDWRWSRMTHMPCGSSVRFVNATRDRVDHYCRLHRCGGHDWTGS
jgi:hypothetical protein